MQFHPGTMDLNLFIEGTEMFIPFADSPAKVAVFQLNFIAKNEKERKRCKFLLAK